MDPPVDPLPPISMDPPPTTTTTTTLAITSAEAAAAARTSNNIAQVVNPNPNPIPTPTPNPNLHPTPHHPPYAEMITAAITALKERNGSSKKAIAKYIDRVYPNLPAKHPALLTHHLKRLKNSGHLIMVKHSYKIPTRSAAASAVPSSSPSLNTTTTTSSSAPPLVGPAQPKKRPGRPPKPKPVFQGQPQTSVGPGNPAQIVVPFVGPEHSYDAGFAVGPGQDVAFGPAPLSQKRKPGRPPKPKPGVVPAFPHVAAQSSIPPPVVQTNGPAAAAAIAKRRPGRPRKLLDSGGPRQSSKNPVGLGGLKRRPGRPPKIGPAGFVNGQPKRRGRKPKNVQQAAPFPAAAAAAAVAVPNAVPYLQPQASIAVGVNGVSQAVAKRRGRPPNPLGRPKKPRKLSGKPLGRPKKRGVAPDASQNLTAYLNLKSKLEYLQSRIKETVGVLKPFLNSETSGSAIGALQQLEELAALDVNAAPLNVQAPQQVQENNAAQVTVS